MIGGLVDPGPKAGDVGRDFPVGLTEEGIKLGVAEVAGVGDLGGGAVGEGFCEVSGSAVVPVAKARSENKNPGKVHLMKI